MRFTRAIALPIAMIMTCVTSVAAQVRTGHPVRWTEGGTTRRALFRELAPGGRVIVDTPDSAVVLDPATSAIEYRNGTRTKWGSAGIGLMVGAAIGGVAGLASGDDVCEPGWFGCLFAYTAGEKAMMGIMGGGVLGALVGVVAIPASRWVALRTDSGTRVALVVRPGRIGANITF